MDAMEEDQPFELEAYASNYLGHARVERLLFIADKKQGTAFGDDALRLAVEELSQSENTQKYQEVAAKLGGNSVNRAQLEQKERKAAQRHDRLEAELNNYKTNLIKESIRMGHNDMGDFFYSRGDLQSAFKSYVRTRDYCTSGKHVIQMCLNVIKVSIELGNYVHVNNYISKAEQTAEVQKDPVVAGKLRAAGGLAALQAKKYKLAARKFAEVPSEMATQYQDVLSAQDVAVYGGLCALASFDRSELRSHVINNVTFRDYMEVNPEVRELVNDFYGSRYASCLNHLTRLRPMLDLDPYIHAHLNTLYASIRSKALVQYTTPFTSVNLPTMAEAFKTDISGLEKELAELIQSSQIQARIDSHNKVLYARHTDQRKATFQTALRTAEQYLGDTKALLLRANLLKHDFAQKQGEGQEQGHGRGGRRGGNGGGHGGGGHMAPHPYLGALGGYGLINPDLA
ncbi:COP9/signalosome complex subunit Csn1 [Trebouxia sp. C0010 RCD-2024]